MKNLFVFAALLLASIAQAQEANAPIHVKVTGQGAPIMLIPGFTVPGEGWDALLSDLEGQYECHTVTLAGFGHTAPIDFPWLPKVNEALEAYIHDKGLNDVTIIGHSLGGTVAAWLGSREGNLVGRLILVDALPASGALMMPDFNPDHLVYDNSFSAQQLAMGEAEFEQMATGMAMGMSLNAEAQQRIKDWILISDRKTYVYGYTDYLKLDLREDLKHISAPVTIIAADKPYGKEMAQQTYRSQYANLKDYELIIAHDAAHFVMYDQPAWFAEQIAQILRK